MKLRVTFTGASIKVPHRYAVQVTPEVAHISLLGIENDNNDDDYCFLARTTKTVYRNWMALTGCIFFTSIVGMIRVAKQMAKVTISTSNTCHQTMVACAELI